MNTIPADLRGHPGLAGLQACADRTLFLLRAIEATTGSLDADRKIMAVMVDEGRGLLRELADAPLSGEADAQGKARASLEAAHSVLQRLHQVVAAKRAAAAADDTLRDDDGVVDAFDAYLECLEDLLGVIDDLHDQVDTRDALREPAIGNRHKTVDSLFAEILGRG